MKAWWRRRRKFLLGGLVFWFARLLWLSMRVKVIGKENALPCGRGRIFVGWHGKTLMPANYFYKQGVWALFSLSNDGELQSRIFKRFGFQVIRGSTGRGGARALIESIRVLRAGDAMAITPDGPRGPECRVQPGVLAMAQKSGAVLVPVGTSARHATRLGTWDRYMIPWFFTKGAVCFGEPLEVAANATEAELEAVRLALERAVERAEDEADRACGRTPPVRSSVSSVSEALSRAPATEDEGALHEVQRN
ncbi:MAG: lysophospholipid acyltransferase family protein [Armatimonadetes bacterium]|nr:lysophospholipid acyltransferase family protein [Armatimonadota bacterium]